MLSGDQVGIDEINSGADIHEGNKVAFNLPTRLIAKTYLFRTIFRGNGWSFANDPNFSHVSTDPDYWDDINNQFYCKYRGLDEWHNRLKDVVIRGQPIVGPTGRFWKIPMKEYQKKNWKTGKLENVLDIPWTTLSNYPVQGTGADIMKVARISLWNRLKKTTTGSLLVSTVHDDLKLDVPDNELDFVINTALEVFDDLPKNFKKLFNVDMPIPFPGEVSVGKDLLNMEKV
jgi:DNA polymerase I-like protein with 3'-5' exonuclease and polymerase domains